MAALGVHTTNITGLLVIDLVVHQDPRGWFKENWQRAKMTALGLPDFGPVQHSLAYNTSTGVTRGFHAEPWDKLVSVAHGRIFGAWVDLRPGPGFGSVFTTEVGPDKAVFVPRGVANSYQTLEPETVYSYLVNDHWSPEARASYSYVNLADETLGVEWPIPLAEAVISEADAAHPRLANTTPVPPKRTLIVGANGQLGRALRALLPEADGVDLPDFDVSDAAALASYPWAGVGTIINASAYTAVDAAETPEGRLACWRANVTGVANLTRTATEHRLKLVHVSSDYVFDGTAELHSEDEPFSPLGVYGQTKAAGDALVAQAPQHYLLRTSWVIGAGHNFVRTMAELAAKGVSPTVVDDQYGRLTFTTDLAAAIVHLLSTGAAPGTYNFTNPGPVASWCDIAREVFTRSGRAAADVSGTTTQAYAAGKLAAPRPANSALDLTKIEAAGFSAPSWLERLDGYLQEGQTRP
ncbi:MAG: bifunctional dTDP-4-dehydrorhamnose 3,5-epimerase family protein/NAD(P)-dependent oxidoreductase [Propionicimonas sp.]|uniref:bifunctional dTDP-4-dehydrorhamnose 3,5-epimerase family protein/NAD(P)-dependent oxidoreductase n=1 Tax=Propionicimonas sp. TaxID=1955623 RepID=UPI001DC656E0|nr:bifunctional dTDP-4-dehydrorhamnose 3,5-epimerase family protein/NAD(P)-dependent oxidoreductase [Propionicimonas sp.]MBU4186794.1 bifunctional dTDP-4-dehydrorhamnose 3,5-epimerase family protein/NAD(P)-dependent oxidoreductase [Actinomycetota bacterium]MBU4207937.1 bifunctional dTDP-4-dehydrorhamnose 3,5-epimerase family protein/NAD(P)-dependent oxidoreductase [Actinomycetota bacterium]MBU4249941.1 bifunctional dTDP-4-dehydrorhamnose 3,5-epimerase family protein/NAD(P)-dependent oxidoreducta